MKLSALTAVSPIDGRYNQKTNALSKYFSEFGFIKYRLNVEIEWLKALSKEKHFGEIPRLSPKLIKNIAQLGTKFSANDAEEVKAIEKTTNHDVKAIEYWFKQKLDEMDDSAKKLKPFIHFACTSEDINNLAYALMLKDSRSEIMVPTCNKLIKTIKLLAKKYSTLPMLSRTHGQAATPTTLGKEMANFASRMISQIDRIQKTGIFAKMNGATGNYNAHLAAYPNFQWDKFCENFVKNQGLNFTTHSTQIEPHDKISELFDGYGGFSNILLDLNRDIWGYISLGYFKQITSRREVGSSTMPHKVNPIDFENSEGNIGVANALFSHFSSKLPISRWQRDLTDSTTLRNIGVAIGHTYLAYQSSLAGLGKIEANKAKVMTELDNSWEILAEPIQVVMKRYGIDDAYEQLKTLTRGKESIDKALLHEFIETLRIPRNEKNRLLKLTPRHYIGHATHLAKNL